MHAETVAGRALVPPNELVTGPTGPMGVLLGQGLPVEVLETHEEEAARGVSAHVVHDDDPGMGPPAAARASVWKRRS